jgi:hypothetical protein
MLRPLGLGSPLLCGGGPDLGLQHGGTGITDEMIMHGNRDEMNMQKDAVGGRRLESGSAFV